MSETADAGPEVHIRASAGAPIDARKVGRAVLVLCAVLVAAVVVATTVGAARQNSSQTRLERSGRAVVVTVTGCEGVSSGIGQAVVYYLCHGSYALDGHRYDEVIGGDRTVHPVGQALRAVAVPGDPALVATAGSVTRRTSPWAPYVTPIALTGGTLVLVAAGLLWRRRRRARTQPPAVA